MNCNMELNKQQIEALCSAMPGADYWPCSPNPEDADVVSMAVETCSYTVERLIETYTISRKEATDLLIKAITDSLCE